MKHTNTCNIKDFANFNDPVNSEMALAVALHIDSEQLYKFALLKKLNGSNDAFMNWLQTVKAKIEFYESSNA